MDHGHKSLVKRQHSTRRRCIGLEGAVNTTASSVPLKHEPRVEGGGAAAKRRGRAGSVRSAAGGVRPPPPSSRDGLRSAGGVPSNVRPLQVLRRLYSNIPRTNGGFDPCRAPTMSHEVYGASLVATIASHAQGTWIVRIRRAQSLESGLHSTEAWRPATCSCRPEGVR